MAKYRKKPIVIEAYRTDKEIDIPTLEGVMHANVGDYIITGVMGEQYPCKPDIFEATYERVDPYDTYKCIVRRNKDEKGFHTLTIKATDIENCRAILNEKGFGFIISISKV